MLLLPCLPQRVDVTPTLWTRHSQLCVLPVMDESGDVAAPLQRLDGVPWRLVVQDTDRLIALTKNIPNSSVTIKKILRVTIICTLTSLGWNGIFSTTTLKKG